MTTLRNSCRYPVVSQFEINAEGVR